MKSLSIIFFFSFGLATGNGPRRPRYGYKFRFPHLQGGLDSTEWHRSVGRPLEAKGIASEPPIGFITSGPNAGGGLTCVEVKAAGSGSKFSLEALKTLSDDSVTSCLLFLGKNSLGFEEGRYIWKRLVKIYQGDISNIPENELQQLGWITRAISPKDIKNLTLSDIDTIASFGQYHNLTQVQALAERVREDWSAKEPSDYTFYDLIALNHILCGFNTTYISLIHPDSYKEAANVLSTLQDCPREPLEALASLAVSHNAFDDPTTWYSSQTKSVGCILNGMSSDVIASIPPEGMESLTPDVIPCLFKETLKSMTIWQLKHLTPSAAAAISHFQKSFLTFEQQKSIDEASYGGIGSKNSGSGIYKSDFELCFLGFWLSKILA